MSTCCTDPTEPIKLDLRELRREQELHGNLLRDLFTEHPEKVMLQQLRSASTYLRELAALRAHYDSVRKQAISLLDSPSIATLERIIKIEASSDIAKAALIQLEKITE
jgi:hypothetical protein